MQQRGQSTIVTWLFVAAMLALLYAAIMFIPAYVDNLSVKESIETAFTKGFTVADETIAENVIIKLNGGPTAVGYHYEYDENGTRTEVPGLNILPENVKVFRDEASRSMTITVDYVREIQLKPTKSIKTLHFHVEKDHSYQ